MMPDDLELLWSILATHHGAGFELQAWPEGRYHRLFVPYADWRAFMRLATMDDCQVGAVPRNSGRHGDIAAHGSVIWARLDSGEQAKKLASLRHGPTLLLREGRTVRRVALWALTRSVRHAALLRANRRLAHRLGCKLKDAEPDTFMVPCPGSQVAKGRRSPLPVVVEYRAEERVYAPEQVPAIVGPHDPPPLRDWRAERAAA